jgi:DNA-binding GntR family transcriptional regulator
MLELKLIRATAEKITAQDISRLRAIADEFEKAFDAGDRATARGVNYRFHRELYDIAAMPQTLHFVQILWARYPFDLINAVAGRGKDAAKEHDEILQALLHRDSSAATLAMRKHIESGWTLLKAEQPPSARAQG